MSSTHHAVLTMTKRQTGQGLIDIAVMGDRKEVLIPFIPAWSREASRIATASFRE